MSGVIVHEWFESHGGAEKVVQQFASIFPEADIQVLWNDTVGVVDNTRIKETWLAKTPLRKHKALALPLMPSTWRNLKSTDQYDWILVSSHLFAHHAKFLGINRDVPKYVYAHTPARYIWEPDLDQRGRKRIARLAQPLLRELDSRRAKEPASIAANSEFVRDRIRRTWKRDCEVIYPPVDVAGYSSFAEGELTGAERELLSKLPEEYLLGASRFIPYKRLDIVIRAGEQTGIPVVLAGGGPLLNDLLKLANQASVPVQIVEFPSQNLLKALYRRSLAFVFPPIEDFGIMPVEAMAAGTPVIARNIGGAAESVVDGLTGATIADFTKDEIQRAVEKVREVKSGDCIERAQMFNSEAFAASVREWVTN